MTTSASADDDDGALNAFWIKYYVDASGRCALCANTGALTAHSGHSVMCICPNGRKLRMRRHRVTEKKPPIVGAKFGSRLLPADFFVEDVGSQTKLTTHVTELSEARDIAVAYPGKCVQVGLDRWLTKDPSAWCSEVDSQQKRQLQVNGGVFRAHWWDVDTDETPPAPNLKLYGKGLVFHASGNVGM